MNVVALLIVVALIAVGAAVVLNQLSTWLYATASALSRGLQRALTRIGGRGSL
jgi:hypothetical protein